MTASYDAMLDELEMDQAEGEAEGFSEEFDALEAEGLDAGDEFDGYEDGFDEYEEGDGYDDFDELEAMDSYDGFEAGEEYGDEEAWESGMAYAMAAEDSDEFFRRLRRVAAGVARGVRAAAPIVGRIARVAAPVLSAIPHPAAQVAARVARLAGRLRMEAVSEEEALEAAAELAARLPAAIPVAAGIAARLLVRRVAPRLSVAQRRRVVRQIMAVLRMLVQRQGPPAARALPRIVQSVRRNAAVRRTPALARPRVLANTTRRVAQMPQLARRLAAPLPRGRAIVRRAVPSVAPVGPAGARRART